MADDVKEPGEPDEYVRAATIAVLQDGGAMTYIVNRDAAGWVVGGVFPCKGYDTGKSFTGHTAIDPLTSNDPRDMAARLVAQAKAHAEKMDAFLTTAGAPTPITAAEPPEVSQPIVGAPDLASGGDPLGGEDLGHEMLAAEDEAGAISEDALPAPPVELLEADTGAADGATAIPAEPVAASEPITDAAPPATDETLHAEIADETPAPEAFAGTVIQAGDPLEAWRSQRIGDVARIALGKTPAIDDAKLVELRNFAQGVAEGRWPDSPAVRSTLDYLEAQVQLAGRLQAFATTQTKALLTGSRSFVENFKAEDGWPE